MLQSFSYSHRLKGDKPTEIDGFIVIITVICIV